MKITMIQKTIWRSKSVNTPPNKDQKKQTDFSKYLKEESIKAGLNPYDVLKFYKEVKKL